MAYLPTLTDYASLIINLFRRFNQDPQNQQAKQGRALTYTEESFIIFFIIMQYRGIYAFKSLFNARGPVWHQKHRRQGHIPDGLRGLDTDATWCKSSYHGWVYGYAFPTVISIETVSVSESEVLDSKEGLILAGLLPKTLAADDAYTKAMRIRRWAGRGVALLTPALRWAKGRYAEAHHRFVRLPGSDARLRRRRTSIEPLFDLIGKVIGANGPQKQLAVKHLDNVRPCLALAIFSVQVAMIANSIWGLPHRNISHMAAAFQ